MKTSFAHLEGNRITTGPLASKEGERTGVFLIEDESGVKTFLKADCGSMSGWESISITSLKKSDEGITPMLIDLISVTTIKDMFWDKNETVVMFFSEDVHGLDKSPIVTLWKSKRQSYILPPKELFTPQEKPSNVVPLPTPSPEEKTP